MDEAGVALGTRLALGALTAGGERLRVHCRPAGVPSPSQRLQEAGVCQNSQSLQPKRCCAPISHIWSQIDTHKGAPSQRCSVSIPCPPPPTAPVNEYF